MLSFLSSNSMRTLACIIWVTARPGFFISMECGCIFNLGWAFTCLRSATTCSMLGKPFSWIIFLSLLKSSIWSSWSQWKRAYSSLFTCWWENQRFSYSHHKTRAGWGRYPFSLYRITETPRHPYSIDIPWQRNEPQKSTTYRDPLVSDQWTPTGFMTSFGKKEISIDTPSYRNQTCKGTVSHRLYEFVWLSKRRPLMQKWNP